MSDELASAIGQDGGPDVCEFHGCTREWTRLVHYEKLLLRPARGYCEPHAREETGKHDDARLFKEVDHRE